ncbi:MAG TPA: hypothetical protein VGX97_09565 [bacterium]|nr:hypothetical protein [bacterium]
MLIVALLAVLVVAPGLAQRASAQPGAYTGLVIVVRAIHLDRSISPAVLTPAGEIVYGRGWWKPGQLNADFAEHYGIVEYAPSLVAASRAGPRPLIVYAIGVSGPVLSNFKTDVVVSTEDALLIRDANTRSRFLQQMRVAFVNQPVARRLPY